MNKYILLLLIVISAVTYNIFITNNNNRVLKVGIECDHIPYNWEESIDTGNNFELKDSPGLYVEGYDAQMASIIAKELGMTVEFHKISFDELISALNRHEIDVIFSGMVDTEERKALINFTVPYESRVVEYAMLVHRKSEYANARRLQDFSGARVAAQNNSRFDEVIDQIDEVNHMPALTSLAAILIQLSERKIDATVVNYDSALSYERTHPELKAIRFRKDEGFVLGFTGLCAGVRKSDKTLLDNMNNAIKSIPIRDRQRVMDRVVVRAFAQE